MPAFAPDFNPNARVIRRVRLDLSHNIPSPYKEMLKKLPYADWLKAHTKEVRSLKNEKEEPLLTAVHPRTGQTKDGQIFITDFEFASQTALDYYNAHYLAIMRGRIEESYPGATIPGSPFSYRIALNTDVAAFASLLEQIPTLKPIE